MERWIDRWESLRMPSNLGGSKWGLREEVKKVSYFLYFWLFKKNVFKYYIVHFKIKSENYQ